MSHVLDHQERAAGERESDYATDDEARDYWIGYCRDKLAIAAERKELTWLSRRIVV